MLLEWVAQQPARAVRRLVLCDRDRAGVQGCYFRDEAGLKQLILLFWNCHAQRANMRGMRRAGAFECTGRDVPPLPGRGRPR
jgi:hypothetical protein